MIEIFFFLFYLLIKSVSVRVGEWNLNTTIDCDENFICADKPYDIPFDRVFTRFDPNYSWSYNIGLIKLSKAAVYSSNCSYRIFQKKS